MDGTNDIRPDDGPEAPAGFRPFTVAVRVLLLLLAAGAATLAVAIAVRDRAGGEASIRYACPMHAQVRAAGPGECPICRMALEPVGRGAASPSLREMAAMADMNAVENVRKHNIVDFVRRRTPLFNGRELRGPAWIARPGIVEVVLYKDQIEALSADEIGTFTPTATPAARLEVQRTAEPPAAWDRSTSLLRFRIREGTRAKSTARTPPAPGGEAGWLELEPRPREVLTVPASAVVQSPEGPYVLAWIGGFSFEKRPIEIGETFLKQGFAVVLSGLRPNERVVSRATFFIDADRRIGAKIPDEGWVAQ
ncbi:MAG: heavy metal-binding domain-containing protein [Myxococcales bacterium]